MNKIEIYTASTCGYCKTLKDELTKNNIEFEEKITTDFKDEYQAIVNLGKRQCFSNCLGFYQSKPSASGA